MRSLSLLLLLASACTPDEGPQPPLGPACAGAKVFASSADPEQAGQWPVGARTITIAGLTAEVWYPARRGSEVGKPTVTYDLREHLPPSEMGKISDANNPLQSCNCYRDLPLDDRRGPYPAVIFIHGTASFRTQSLPQVTHWASRGFVVVAADHPGINLTSVLDGSITGGQEAIDADNMLIELRVQSGMLSFLAGHLDNQRLAVTGHSAGGIAVKYLGDEDGVQVIMPLAGGGVQPGKSVRSTLVMGAHDDMIVPYTNQQDGYASSAARKRLVGLNNAGHLAFSELCTIGADHGGILKIAQDAGVAVPALVIKLASDGCAATQLPPARGWAVINHATTAALEETLLCNPAMTAQLSSLSGNADVAEYAESL